MLINKSKLTGVMLAILIAGNVCTYAKGTKKGDTLSDSCLNLLLEHPWDHQEIIANLKNCIAEDSIHLIASKDVKMVVRWGTTEAENGGRVVSMRLNKETGVCVAVSAPKHLLSPLPEMDSKNERKKITADCCKELSVIFDKAASCLAMEDVHVIETTDIKTLMTWVKKEAKDENRVCKMNLDEETGIYAAVSKPKTEDEK